MIKVKKSANLFSNYISKEFKNLKRHGVFLIFLKRALNHLVNLNFSKVEGVKIIISGRLNSAPRSKKKIIIVGNIPVQSLKKNINYSQTVSYSKNGTFGIKVWICYK